MRLKVYNVMSLLGFLILVFYLVGTVLGIITDSYPVILVIGLVLSIVGRMLKNSEKRNESESV